MIFTAIKESGKFVYFQAMSWDEAEFKSKELKAKLQGRVVAEIDEEFISNVIDYEHMEEN